MAVRIGKATKTFSESWLYMQAKLDLWNLQRKPAKVELFKRIAGRRGGLVSTFDKTKKGEARRIEFHAEKKGDKVDIA